MLEISYVAVSKLKPHSRNSRTHSKKQIQQIANSIGQFGFVNPVLIDENGIVIAGHGRLLAATLLQLDTVPTITLHGLSEAQKRALMLADNKIAANAGWDREKLAIEIPELSELLKIEGLDIELTGYNAVEIDQIALDSQDETADPDDTFEEAGTGMPVSRLGDLWILDKHQLLCGNARLEQDVRRLMAGAAASMAFLDPPYNVKVSRVVGRGHTKHREFTEASGEQSEAEFIEFLSTTLGNAAQVCASHALHYVCMDWRHAGELLAAGKRVYAEHINTVVWVKSNAGMGSFYRSQHEEIFVFRTGDDQHTNNIELGRHGRSRSNVWSYTGANTFRPGRMDDLRAHPTVKPISLVADAMRDCTKRGAIVLDVFCGSGTTILAAERVGRRGFGLEIDPLYVDTAIRRWQAMTGKDAVLAESGATFEDVQSLREPAAKG